MDSSTLVSVIILLTISCSSCDMEALTFLMRDSLVSLFLTIYFLFLELTTTGVSEESSSLPLEDPSSSLDCWAFFFCGGAKGGFLLLRAGDSSSDESSSSLPDEDPSSSSEQECCGYFLGCGFFACYGRLAGGDFALFFLVSSSSLDDSSSSSDEDDDY